MQPSCYLADDGSLTVYNSDTGTSIVLGPLEVLAIRYVLQDNEPFLEQLQIAVERIYNDVNTSDKLPLRRSKPANRPLSI